MKRRCARLEILPGGDVRLVRRALELGEEREAVVAADYTALSTGTEFHELLASRRDMASASGDEAGGGGVAFGYMLAGRVVDAWGSDADLRVGDRVVATAGHVSHCVVEGGGEEDGFWNRVEPVPDGVGLREAPFAIQGAVAVHAAHRAELVLGSKVCVLGGGMIGQLVARVARAGGAEQVTLVDSHAFRRKIASTSGHLEAMDVAEATDGSQRGRYDRVFVCTDKVHAIAMAIELTRQGGMVVLVGLSMGDERVDLASCVRRDVTLRGSLEQGVITRHKYWQGGTIENRRLFLSMMADQRLDISDLITHELSPDEACDFIQRLPTLAEDKEYLGVVVRWP